MKVKNNNLHFQTFKSLRLKNSEGNYSDTAFYRDYEALIQTAKLLEHNFPNGCDILDFASSNGEEAISLYSLINPKKRKLFNIFAFDSSAKAIDLAQKGIYTVFSPYSYDYYLIEEPSPYIYSSKETKKIQNYLKSCFNNLMQKSEKPDHEINDVEIINRLKSHDKFNLQHFSIRQKYRDKFNFKLGNIKDIKEFAKDKRVGAVLFRNAMYIETKNLSVNEFNFYEDLNINKRGIIENIVSKIYQVLEPNGLFILGNIEKEHIYIADNSVDDKDTLFYPEYCAKIFKNSPLWNALNKNNLFKAVGYSSVAQAAILKDNIKLPTIWQKVMEDTTQVIFKMCK